MNTSLAEEHINANLDPSTLQDGTKRWLGESEEFRVEIIPNKSVALFISKINGHIFDIINLYINNSNKTLAILQKGAAFVKDNPNTDFQEQIGNDLLLKLCKIQAGDGVLLHLKIGEE